MAAFQIKGIDGIERALAELPDKVAKKVIRQAIRASLKPVAAEVKSSAPVLTGATRAAVKVKAGKANRKSISLNVAIGKGDYTGDQYYASFVEFGTKKMKARHFMEGAYGHTAEAAKAEAEQLILDGILREADATGGQ